MYTYSVILHTFTLLWKRSPELFHLAYLALSPLHNSPLSPTAPIPGNHCSTSCFYEFGYCRNLVSRITQDLSYCDWLISLTKSRQGSAMLYNVTGFPDLLRLNKFCCMYNTIVFSIHSSMDILIVSPSWLLWIVMLWTQEYKYLFKPCFQFFWLYTQK